MHNPKKVCSLDITNKNGVKHMNLIEGQIYKVNHRRKGEFNLMVTTQDDTWVTGLIVEGKASSILKYNEYGPSEEITIRKDLCKFQEVN